MQTNLESSLMMDFLRTLPELFSGGIYLVEPTSGEILFANDFFKKEFGCDPGEDGCHEIDLVRYFLPEDLEIFKANFLSTKPNMDKERIVSDFRMAKKDSGEIRWFQFEKKRLVRPEIEACTAHLVFVRDVTNEKVNEGNITEQIQFFLSLFENASVGMALQDWEGGYFRVNPKFTEITGYSIQNLTELNIKRIKGDKISDEEKEYFSFFKEGAEESKLTRKDGRRINVYRRVNTFRNSNGRPDFYYVFLDDVTEKKQIESYQVHSQTMETIGSLATNIAHDLNNYLQPIHVFSQLGEEMVRSNQLNLSTILDYFAKIRSGANNARDMIHRIIKYSNNKVENVVTKVDISNIIESTIPILLAGIPKNVELQFDFFKSPLFAKVDPILFSKILSEIISGGLFVWDDRKRGFVQVKTLVGQDRRVSIKLELIGLSLSTLDFHSDPSKIFLGEDELNWTGLHLINRYIKNWGGEFIIQKPDPMVLEIQIYLPSSEEFQLEHVSKQSSVDVQSPEEVWEEIRKKKFWVVEDDESASEAIQFVLSEKGIDPKVFSSSNEALLAMQLTLPDFLLSDYRMKQMTGLTLIRKLKEKKPSLSAVLYTGNLDGLDVEELEAEGILVRSKPISVDELYESILLSFGFL